MMDDSSTLPVPSDAAGRVSPIAQLADIPEEESWLSKQKSARTRRAYRLVRSEAQSSITSLCAANELADNTIVEL